MTAKSEYKLGLTGARSGRRRIRNFKTVLQRVGEVNDYLEIGVCEGWSAKWWLDNSLRSDNSRYVGIDAWVDWPKQELSGGEVYRSACDRLKPYGSKVELITGWSMNELVKMSPKSFDVIYIDGNHDLLPVMIDSVLSWRLLRVGGVLLWDDYGQRARGKQPKNAVQGFLRGIKGRYELLFENWQMAVVKTKHATEDWG